MGFGEIICRVARVVVVIGIVVLPSVSAARNSDQCAKPPKTDIFGRVSTAAESLTCNDHGFWEANFGELQSFIFVPAGEFTRGSKDGLPDERPVRQISLDGYWIAKYPVTVEQFRSFVDATGYITDAERGWGSWQWTGERVDKPGTDFDPWFPMIDGGWNNIYFEQGEDHPVGSVSWNDANAYATWLSSNFGVNMVLPTEAQWEKAARGTDGRRFPWGNESPNGNRLNFADRRFAEKYGKYARRPDLADDDGYVETSPVDAFPLGQSPYGAFDMAGNLGEWTNDIYVRGYYADAPDNNPLGPDVPENTSDQNIDRVNRGGSWVDWAGVDAKGKVRPEGGHSVRSAARTGDEQNSSDDHMGFRLAVDGVREATIRLPDPYMPDLTGVTINTYIARNNVYMLEASGDVAGNIAALVGPEGILVVDDQFAELLPAIETTLENLHAGELRYVLNTHHHDDHSDGNAYLAAHNHATVIGHDRTRERLKEYKGPGHWPAVTFDSTMTIHFNLETVRLVSLPGGHTDNDVVVFFERANVAHLGDLMNSGKSSFPIIDLGAGGNALTMRENVGKLLEMVNDETVIIPGHGPLSDKKGLRVLHHMLVDTIGMVEKKKISGLSLSTIIKEGMSEEYRDWGYGFTPANAWLSMVWASLEAASTEKGGSP